MKERYYQMAEDGKSAKVIIYGDITSWPWMESDVSSYNLSHALDALPDEVSDIEVHINSYGGEVAEGVAIYHALKNHPAHVTTVCDGFACSIASVIFMAGDARIMNDASLLMIHNASGGGRGTADDHRKDAEDLDIVTSLSEKIYLASTDLDEAELKEWMDSETFIASEDALARGFATEVRALSEGSTTQSAREAVSRRMTQKASVSISLGDSAEFAQKVALALEQRADGEREQAGGEERQARENPATTDETEPQSRLLSFFQAIAKER